MSKQWQQIVLQTNVAAVIQGIPGKRKKVQAEVSRLSRPQAGTGTNVFHSAWEMSKESLLHKSDAQKFILTVGIIFSTTCVQAFASQMVADADGKFLA